jgi:hypothetical protein
MRLYLDLMSLSLAAGADVTARKLVFNAGHRPIVEYVPCAGRAEAPAHPPMLVTDAGEVVSGLREIIDWLSDPNGSGSPHVLGDV